jgi:hypothetical protein
MSYAEIILSILIVLFFYISSQKERIDEDALETEIPQIPRSYVENNCPSIF